MTCVLQLHSIPHGALAILRHAIRSYLHWYINFDHLEAMGGNFGQDARQNRRKYGSVKHAPGCFAGQNPTWACFVFVLLCDIALIYHKWWARRTITARTSPRLATNAPLPICALTRRWSQTVSHNGRAHCACNRISMHKITYKIWLRK